VTTNGERAARPGRSWLVDDGPAKTSPVRKYVGSILVTLAVLVGIGFGLGVWNPWKLVFLNVYFGNVFAGMVLMFALLLVGVWVLTPVTSEARQSKRQWARLGLGAGLLVMLMAWGVAGDSLGGDHKVVATSADGTRRLVMITHSPDDRELRIWAGKGLGARDRGWLGLACGEVVGTFSGNDQVQVVSVYGDFDLRLDPKTGTPIDTIGPTCSG
jgi:hypothetical protein